MKRFFRGLLLLVVFVCLGCGVFLLWGYLKQDGIEKKMTARREKDIQIINDFSVKESKTAKEFLDELRSSYGSQKILGYLSTGKDGINEPFVHYADDSSNYTNLYGSADETGTVFLYRENESPDDLAATYFGHLVGYAENRFTKLGRFEENRENLQELKVYTDKGVREYNLVYAVKLPSSVYDGLVTWTSDGLKGFWEESSSVGTVYENRGIFKDDKRYSVLSACGDLGALTVVVGVYEEVGVSDEK